jgi:putative component of toxin-antitoxin plasmid stabilization module
MYSILTTEQFDKWFSALRDRKAKTLVQVRIDRMEDGNRYKNGDSSRRRIGVVKWPN